MEIKIYSTNWCPYCANTKRFLDEKGIEYEEININKNKMSLAYNILDLKNLF